MRLRLIKIFFALFFIAITVRLFYWQILNASILQAKAEGQHFRDIKIRSSRGSIYFSDSFPAVTNNPVYSMYGIPKQIKEDKKVEVAYTLARIVYDSPDSKVDEKEIDKIARDFINKLSQPLYWIVLKTNISVDKKQKIDALKLPGVEFEQSSQRFYPEGSTAANLLGFVGSDANGDPTGYFGIEGYYQGDLKGVSGLIRHEADTKGSPILIGEFLTQKAKNGKNINLNIDRSIQFIAENSLRRGIDKYGAKAGSVTIMDPKTGAVLALAAFPGYDPYEFSKYSKEYYKNSVVGDQYEPGSTFKVLVMASAINEDLIKSDTKCDICEGPVTIAGNAIRTWNNKYQKDATMKDVLVHSDNTGMVYVGKKLGIDKFYEYLENFGFGSKTNIDLEDEFSSQLKPKESWREIDLATASFGQGIAITPIQMIRAVSAIANGGNLMEPHVVNSITDGGKVFNIKPKIIKQVLKPETTKIMIDMMASAVEEGESKWAKPKGFKIAGKTGTAQIPVAGHYDPDKTIASFVGFAPADDPKFVMLVRYDQPTSSIYGSETAAPTFFEIAKQLFNYYKIAPTQ